MLIVLLVVAAGGVPLIENPNSTLINHHPRFTWIVALFRSKGWSIQAELLCFEFLVVGSMGCFGSGRGLIMIRFSINYIIIINNSIVFGPEMCNCLGA